MGSAEATPIPVLIERLARDAFEGHLEMDSVEVVIRAAAAAERERAARVVDERAEAARSVGIDEGEDQARGSSFWLDRASTLHGIAAAIRAGEGA